MTLERRVRKRDRGATTNHHYNNRGWQRVISMESFIQGNEVFVGTIGVLVIGIFIAFIMMGGFEGGWDGDTDIGDWD